jgi:hypothetical protein
MQDILFYNTTTGEIIGHGLFEDDDLVATITADLDTGEDYLVGLANEEQDYITFPSGVPTITARPAIVDYNVIDVTADNTVTVDFVLPTGTTVTYLSDETISAASEHFQFKSNGIIGVYEFWIDPPFPYIAIMPLTVTVNAV